MGLSHFLMTWKAGDFADAKNHKVKNRNITGGVDGGNTRLTRGVDNAEFFPPCLKRSLPGLPPGVMEGNLLLNKVNYEIPHFPRILCFIMNNLRERNRRGP